MKSFLAKEILSLICKKTDIKYKILNKNIRWTSLKLRIYQILYKLLDKVQK